MLNNAYQVSPHPIFSVSHGKGAHIGLEIWHAQSFVRTIRSPVETPYCRDIVWQDIVFAGTGMIWPAHVVDGTAALDVPVAAAAVVVGTVMVPNTNEVDAVVKAIVVVQ